MIILNQIIKITKKQWQIRKHAEFFANKGYDLNNSFIEVSVNDLPNNERSTYNVKVTCDYCGREITKPYNFAIKDSNHCCSSGKCIYAKAAKTNVLKYGNANPSQRDDIKKKKEQIFLDKYGVTNAYQIESVRNSTKEKLGVEYPFQSKKIREIQKQTMINKYGVENPGLMGNHKEKCSNTCIKRYGVSHHMHDLNIKEKAITNAFKGMYKYGTVATSKQQRHLYEILGGEINYLQDNCFLDIAFPNELIYIEYNGNGHYIWPEINGISKEKLWQKEMKRYSYLKDKNWKLIRIVCRCDKLYSDDLLVQLINNCKQYLLNSNHTWIEINIDENKILCSEFNKEIVL